MSYRQLFARCILGLMCGVILGLIFPAYVSWPLFFGIVLAVIILTGLIGRWAFGHNWDDYLIIEFGGPVVVACVGALLGAGKIGTLLITIGTLLSR